MTESHLLEPTDIRVSKKDSSRASALSLGSPQVTKADFAKAMAHMCALKRTTDFTDLQVTAWYGGLRAFPAWIINRAVLTLVTSQERFPEFGDIYQLCRKQAISSGLLTQKYTPYGTGEGLQIQSEEIDSIGDALGLLVRNPNARH